MTTIPTTAQIQAAGARIPTPLELAEAVQHAAAATRLENERLRAQVAELQGGHCPGCDAPGCQGALDAGTQRAYTLDDALSDLALAKRENGRLAYENERLRAEVERLTLATRAVQYGAEPRELTQADEGKRVRVCAAGRLYEGVFVWDASDESAPAGLRMIEGSTQRADVWFLRGTVGWVLE
jgi:hypothetical protein